MLKKLRHYADMIAAVAGAFAVATAIFLAARETAVSERNPLEGGKYVIALDFGHFKIRTDILYAGLCYEMIEDFAAENGCEALVTSYTSRVCGIDSLRQRTADMVLMPLSDSIRHGSHMDSVAFSRKVHNAFRWVVRQEDRNLLPAINAWLKDYTNRESFDGMLERFRFMPSSSKPPKEFREQHRLSPYDDIIKFRADSIGWDWRLLAAVIYTESKFAINVSSPAGAKGLMQIMPLTAKVYNVANPLDPAENIRAGSSYLGRLDRMFRKVPPEDRIKYVLAAYNAGESRILSRMNAAGGEEMADSSETWLENAGIYVEKVLKVYSDFCRICPE